MKLKHLCLLSYLFIIMACHSQQAGQIESVAANQFAYELKQSAKPQLLDVRTAEEYNSQHIEGAQNIDWNGENFNSAAKNLDPSKPVYVYCLSGGRSQKASARLAELGFSKIVELNGGILKWNAAGFAEPNSKIVGMCSQEYEELVKANPKILVNFYAEWCAPCKKMTPYVLQIQKEMAGKIAIVRLNADEHKTLINHLKIEELPALFYYDNQKEVWKHSGFMSETELRAKLN
ncbi:MAG: thioredoxin domain-containing protein [Flavobacterium psychrophilum]